MTTIPLLEDIFDVLHLDKQPLPFYVEEHSIVGKSPLHHHHFIELSFITSGQGTESVNGVKHSLFPGVMSIMMPQQLHQVQSHPSHPIKKYCCMFNMQMMENSPIMLDCYQKLFQIGTTLPSHIILTEQDAHWMEVLFEKLMQEHHSVSRPLTGYRSMICSILTHILLLYLRKAESLLQAPSEKQPADSHRPSDTAWNSRQPIWRILQYVHIHYNQPLTLESTAEQFQISVPYVSKLFKQYTGRSYLEYLHQLRINSAVNLLISTDMLVTDIASETGFESLRTFTRVFQKLKKQTPGSYRSQHCHLNKS